MRCTDTQLDGPHRLLFLQTLIYNGTNAYKKKKKVLLGTQPPKPPGTALDPNAGDLAASTPSASAR